MDVKIGVRLFLLCYAIKIRSLHVHCGGRLIDRSDLSRNTCFKIVWGPRIGAAHWAELSFPDGV